MDRRELARNSLGNDPSTKPRYLLASWASSTSVETVINGSVYYNPIRQALLRNYSKDFHAAVKYVDDILTDESEDEIALVKRAVFFTLVADPMDNTSSFRHIELRQEGALLLGLTEMREGHTP
jgi:hypothetical protein